MSSSASSSSSGDKKGKVKRSRGFLGIKWLGSSTSSGSSSPTGNDCQVVKTRDTPDGSDPSFGFLQGGLINWANPEWEVPEEDQSDQLIILPFPCQVSCSLTIVSRKPIRDLQSLLKKLELWVDQYNGSYVSKPYHTLIYILLGAKLVQRKSTSRNYEYHSKFQGVVRFGVQADRNKPPSDKFRLVMSEGMDDMYYAISFECQLAESKRQGVLYSELYKMSGYHYTFPNMTELLGLNVVINQEGLIASA